MSEIKEQFVTYEIALKLKELSFNEECFGYYCKDKEFSFYGQNHLLEVVAEANVTIIPAPLWQQAQSFLDDNGMIIGIIFVDNVFKYTLNIENYVSNRFKDRMSAIKSATEYATNYLWNKKFNK